MKGKYRSQVDEVQNISILAGKTHWRMWFRLAASGLRITAPELSLSPSHMPKWTATGSPTHGGPCRMAAAGGACVPTAGREIPEARREGGTGVSSSGSQFTHHISRSSSPTPQGQREGRPVESLTGVLPHGNRRRAPNLRRAVSGQSRCRLWRWQTRSEPRRCHLEAT